MSAVAQPKPDKEWDGVVVLGRNIVVTSARGYEVLVECKTAERAHYVLRQLTKVFDDPRRVR